jgi:hypothetical protein
MSVVPCSKCIYCKDQEPGKLDALDKPKIGMCCRHAPHTIALLPNGQTITLWAMVKIYHDGCGDGQLGISTLVPGNGHKGGAADAH